MSTSKLKAFQEIDIFDSNSKLKRGNNSYKMLDRVISSSQYMKAITFYKYVDFQVKSYDSV